MLRGYAIHLWRSYRASQSQYSHKSSAFNLRVSTQHDEKQIENRNTSTRNRWRCEVKKLNSQAKANEGGDGINQKCTLQWLLSSSCAQYLIDVSFNENRLQPMNGEKIKNSKFIFQHPYASKSTFNWKLRTHIRSVYLLRQNLYINRHNENLIIFNSMSTLENAPTTTESLCASCERSSVYAFEENTRNNSIVHAQQSNNK